MILFWNEHRYFFRAPDNFFEQLQNGLLTGGKIVPKGCLRHFIVTLLHCYIVILLYCPEGMPSALNCYIVNGLLFINLLMDIGRLQIFVYKIFASYATQKNL